MFAQACAQMHECIYGLVSAGEVRSKGWWISYATAFMIAPGILVTADHNVRVEGNPGKPVLSRFSVCRAPEIGEVLETGPETASLIATDLLRDLALLRIPDPRSVQHVQFVTDIVPTGTSCGSLGFPLACPSGADNTVNFVERFQGTNISSYRTEDRPSGHTLACYETDSLMYEGSSGSPGFLTDGRVFGMQLRSLAIQTVDHERAGDLAAGIRLAISVWLPSAEIRDFAIANGIAI